MEAKQPPANLRASASWLSAITFWWTLPIFRLGLTRELEVGDLPEPLEEHRTARLGDTLEREWRKEEGKDKPSFFLAMTRTFWKSFALLSVVQVVLELGVKVIQPLFLGRLLRYFTPDSDMSLQEAGAYAGAVVACSAVFVLVLHPYMHAVMHLGMRLRVAGCALVYRKSLRLGNNALQHSGAGQVLNLMSNDVARFDGAPIFLNDIWLAPVELLLCLYLMWRELGAAALVGVATLLLCIPLQVVLGRQTGKLRRQTATKTDERVRLMSQILAGIQVIKMYAWEDAFAKLVACARSTELHSVRQVSQIRGVNLSLPMFVTRVSVCASMVAYALLGNQITAEKVFVLSSYYSIIRHAMTMFFPQAVSTIAECAVSIRRIQEFLELGEARPTRQDPLTSLHQPEVTPRTPRQQPADQAALGVDMTRGTTTWGPGEEATLSDIELQVGPGQLVAVIGPVGAGKSSLLHAVLGELPLTSGTLEVRGRISYAAQEPWLFTGSLRQNVIFGQPWDEVRYRRVLRACALEPDLKLMAHADRTVVGERGVQLSGGQRARVSLARAVYRQADVYLLDDPLSAVDAHVARHLFDECICGLLRHKSVLLVTHQLHFLVQATRILVLEQGRQVAAGTYASLKTSSSLDLERLLSWRAEPRSDSESSDLCARHEGGMLRQTSVQSTKSSLGGLSLGEEQPQEVAELRTQGSVSGQVYARYLRCGGGVARVTAAFCLFLLTQVTLSGCDLWLTTWVNFEESELAKSRPPTPGNTSAPPPSNLSYSEPGFNRTLVTVLLGPEYLRDPAPQLDRWSWLSTEACMWVQSGLVLGLVVVSLARSAFFFQSCMQASQGLHDIMFAAVSRAPMAFFNNNPSGRVLNRFSKDVGSIDETLPYTLLDALQIGLVLLGIVTVVALVNPLMLVPTAAMAAVFCGLRFVFLKTSRGVKRLDGVSRSPVFSHVAASLQGLATIRAFEAQDTLVAQFDALQDVNSSAWFWFISCSRAFGFCLDLVCVLYIALVTFSFLPLGGVAGNVGLAVTQAMGLTGMFQWGMRQSAELENQMTSVERVLEFCDLEPEPLLESPEHEPPDTWPRGGEITLEGVSLRYAPSEVLVLRDLSVHIRPGEKVGIVGRTGAGKSSLISALFRLADLPSGRVLIDGVDTSHVGLRRLRSRISIIPQEPVLFSGTLRSNLDPFAEFSDDQLWGSLEAVQLKPAVEGLPRGLHSEVTAGGGNLSAGQRQLVCLARAVLRGNRLLVLDEATASVDLATDELIQETIRSQFSGCTVLTIAHRINTILDSDRVLVMDAGKMLELASPQELLADPGSVFSQLSAQQSGSKPKISISVTTYY